MYIGLHYGGISEFYGNLYTFIFEGHGFTSYAVVNTIFVFE